MSACRINLPKLREQVIVEPGEGGQGVVPYLPLPELQRRAQNGGAN